METCLIICQDVSSLKHWLFQGQLRKWCITDFSVHRGHHTLFGPRIKYPTELRLVTVFYKQDVWSIRVKTIYFVKSKFTTHTHTYVYIDLYIYMYAFAKMERYRATGKDRKENNSKRKEKDKNRNEEKGWNMNRRTSAATGQRCMSVCSVCLTLQRGKNRALLHQREMCPGLGLIQLLDDDKTSWTLRKLDFPKTLRWQITDRWTALTVHF